MFGKQRRVLALSLVLMASLFAGTQAADAFIHSWSCSRQAGNHCTDPDTTPHGLIETDSGTTGGTFVNSLCTKAITAAGNIRSTTAGNWCDSNTTVVGRCLTGVDPSSYSYSYWESGSGSVTMSDSSESPSNSFC
jgi:hypothetical protein